MITSNPNTVIELPIHGMDCAECALHVEKALAALPGVRDVQVYLAAEKAILHADPLVATLPVIRKTVQAAGYDVPPLGNEKEFPSIPRAGNFVKDILAFLGLIFGAVLLVTVAGEWLGLFERVTRYLPWYGGLALVLIGGFPIFKKVLLAALHKEVIAHTVMTLGVIAAIAVGEWITAAVVVFFMRIGDLTERFTTNKTRQAVKELTAMQPSLARIEQGGEEISVPAEQVLPGQIVLVRPGEVVPVDGVVESGSAAINQSAVTGESMPVEAGPGSHVYAASLLQSGSLRIRTTAAGSQSTFGKIIRLVEEAENNRARVQRFADRFSGWYVWVVLAIALLTILLRRDPLAAAAVLVVACSCSLALATPIAVLASTGAGARQGLIFKGGKFLELLARADILLVDKTGTLTPGLPVITDIHPAGGLSIEETLAAAAAVERHSEHPLAGAVRRAAYQQGIKVLPVENFINLPGQGAQAVLNGRTVRIGNWRILHKNLNLPAARRLEAQGKTIMFVDIEGETPGILAAADSLRTEVPEAINALRDLGFRRIELLTGDNPQSAATLAAEIGISFQAGLLPEDKINIVRRYQREGHTVVMVGDGINDAPALAQADIGIAMGAAGSGIALEAAHVLLMREDWSLVPKAVRIARKTMRVVKLNIGFTIIYNLVGLTLAAFGFLPPIAAAAAQSLPDLGILVNSSRLLNQR
ncbi:MAG: cadmium-translocating P-type ATPase [Anaerolineaceae bacterium]|nr:cadmium-translocating P-type ATPase [Anaerolineaceae bacterium]